MDSIKIAISSKAHLIRRLQKVGFRHRPFFYTRIYHSSNCTNERSDDNGIPSIAARPKNFTYQVTIAYDGTAYSGFQLQKSADTVQARLEKYLIGEQKAICTITTEDRKQIRICSAGRTDAGVHAKGQSIHFRSNNLYIDMQRLRNSINGLLPRDIRALHARRTRRDFHARYHAYKKTYQYQVATGEILDPFKRSYYSHLWNYPDVDAMRKAVKCFIGTHDFSAFANATNNIPQPNPVKTIEAFDIDTRSGSEIFLTVTGNAFLYKMVRNMVGALLHVGRGKLQPGDIYELLQSRDRSRCPPSAVPCGLYLAEVFYPPEILEPEPEEVLEMHQAKF